MGGIGAATAGGLGAAGVTGAGWRFLGSVAADTWAGTAVDYAFGDQGETFSGTLGSNFGLSLGGNAVAFGGAYVVKELARGSGLGLNSAGRLYDPANGQFASKPFRRARDLARRAGGRLRTLLKYEQHHSDPEYLGGAANQRLTWMHTWRHRGLHARIQLFMAQFDEPGRSMVHSPTNSGADIQLLFARAQRLQATAAFYRSCRFRYWDAARDFFRQHPGL